MALSHSHWIGANGGFTGEKMEFICNVLTDNIILYTERRVCLLKSDFLHDGCTRVHCHPLERLLQDPRTAVSHCVGSLKPCKLVNTSFGPAQKNRSSAYSAPEFY